MAAVSLSSSKTSMGNGISGGMTTSSYINNSDFGLNGVNAAQRIKELHKVIAEHERTIRDIKSQTEDNVERINVNINLFIISDS